MILFDDPCCPLPYSVSDLETKSIGGTEASLLRIAHSLSQQGHSIGIMQRGRETKHISSGMSYYTPKDTSAKEKAEVIITLRDAGVYAKNIQSYSHSIHYMWFHDVVSGEYLDHILYHFKDLQKVQLICGSQWHKANILKSIQPHYPKLAIQIQVIPGPLAPYCIKNPDQKYDSNKLIFFSSPHKGLEHTLKIFEGLRKKDPAFQLYLANPGYFADKTDLPDGVINLGRLTHEELMEHVRTALCLFYPNTTFPETFGLVMAEAEAVGTPVIAHPIGAAPEVLSHPKEIMDCNRIEDVIKRVLSYKNGRRLIVAGRPEFTLNRVTQEWIKNVIKQGKKQ